MYTLRRVKILSAFLCMMAKPLAFSPVCAKYSSSTTVQLIRSPICVVVPPSPILFLTQKNKWDGCLLDSLVVVRPCRRPQRHLH